MCNSCPRLADPDTVKIAMSSTRPYLAADDRRDNLLEAAGRVFDREGLAGVTMVATAREAGVSRALVYHCFADQAVLKIELFRRRMQHYRDSVQDARESIDGAVRSGALTMLDRLLDMAPADQYGLSTILHEHGDPEIDQVREELRRLFHLEWAPLLRSDGHQKDRLAVAWVLLETAVSLAIAVDQGHLSRTRARIVLAALVAAGAQAT